MPWWLGLPVLVIWAGFILIAYLVIGLLWGVWLVGHGLKSAFQATGRVQSPSVATAARSATANTRAITEGPERLEKVDVLFPESALLVTNQGYASVELLSTQLHIEYARASHLIDQLAQRGVIAEYRGCKARRVLMTAAAVKTLLDSLG